MFWIWNKDDMKEHWKALREFGLRQEQHSATQRVVPELWRSDHSVQIGEEKNAGRSFL